MSYRIILKSRQVTKQNSELDREVKNFLRDFMAKGAQLAGDGFFRAIGTDEARKIVEHLKQKGLPVTAEAALKIPQDEVKRIIPRALNASKRNEKDLLATENADLTLQELKRKLQAAIEDHDDELASIVRKDIAIREKKNDGTKEYTCQFWEPGLVSYEDSGAGKALLRKESMDKILPSFVGKPVTIDHVEGSPDEIMNAGRAVGTVTNAYWNPDTGWYECKFTVENEDARKKVESGWSVSCAFDVSEQTGPGGEHHAIAYDEEITSGTFTHLALVENPRYEDSKIFRNHKMRLNAKGVKMQNAKTVMISIPYRLLERNDDKNPDQELQAKGMRNVGGGGGVADFEFNGTESQAAAIVKQVLGTVSGVDIGMMNSKRNSDATNKEYDAILKEIQSIHVMTKEKSEAMIAKIDASSLGSSEKDNLEYNLGKQRARSHGKQNDASDFGTILREIKEQLYQMAQALVGRGNEKENEKSELRKFQTRMLEKYGPGWSTALKDDEKKLQEELRSRENGIVLENDYRLKIHTINSNFVGVIYKDGVQIETTGQHKTEEEVKAEGQQKVQELKQKGAKNSRVILKPGKSNSTQEKTQMFGLFKRKSKKNDQAAAPAKLPLEQIDVEIDGVAVPLSELVNEYKAEQAEVAEKAKLEQAQAAKEVTEAPAPEANADNTAPEDLNLDNQEFSIEDGSRYNMTELVDSYNRRKAAKCNADAEAKAKADEEAKKNAADAEAKKKAEEDAKKNASETPEEKAAREKKEADDKAAKENALEDIRKDNAMPEEKVREKLKKLGYTDSEIEQELKTRKEVGDPLKNAKKDPKYFHKLNDLKNAGEVATAKAVETLSDKIERGNARYGSKKK